MYTQGSYAATKPLLTCTCTARTAVQLLPTPGALPLPSRTRAQVPLGGAATRDLESEPPRGLVWQGTAMYEHEQDRLLMIKLHRVTIAIPHSTPSPTVVLHCPVYSAFTALFLHGWTTRGIFAANIPRVVYEPEHSFFIRLIVLGYGFNVSSHMCARAAF